MPDDDKPSGRRLVLKPKEVTPTDIPARPGDGTAISVALMHRQNQIAEARMSLGGRDAQRSPPEVSDASWGSAQLGPKEITPTDSRACAGDGTAVSVPLILKANRMAEDRQGPKIIALPRRKMSKRTRDFILLVTMAGVVVAMFMLQLPRTPGALIMGLFLVAYAAGLLAWVMFGVMDDY